MKFSKSFILLTILSCFIAFQAKGQGPVRFHNESTDTTRINQLLASVANVRDSGERIATLGLELVGTPYVAHTLEGDTEQLTVNLDELDCTTFVETVMALAMTAGEGRTSWRDFIYNLQRLRYRNGDINGYGSRLHYICDWAIDNNHRGNFHDATTEFPAYNYVVRTIDFMSSNRDKYPALTDDAEFERIKSIELGYRNHRFPYIKTSGLNDKGIRKAFRNGDVVGLVTKLKNLDVTHMGIVIVKDGTPYLLHASQANGRVELSSTPLAEYMKKNLGLMGLRVFRM